MVPQEQSLFRGLGNGKFADVSREAGPALDVKTVSRGACFADYDNDGKIDAFVVNLGAPGTLLHNVTQNSNHWLTVKLKGKKSNRDGIGAHLELLSGGRKQIAERIAGSGYLSQDDGRVHFGLGSADEGRQAYHPLAQRAGTGSGESGRGSRAHGGGAVDVGALRLRPQDHMDG